MQTQQQLAPNLTALTRGSLSHIADLQYRTSRHHYLIIHLQRVGSDEYINKKTNRSKTTKYINVNVKKQGTNKLRLKKANITTAGDLSHTSNSKANITIQNGKAKKGARAHSSH